MKARTIAKLRKRILAPGYYAKRMQLALRVARDLERFWKFECSSFFRGEAAAAYNRRVYALKEPRVSAMIRYYERKLGQEMGAWNE